MLNRKSLERALAQYAGHQDAAVRDRLAYFGPALLKAADLKAALPAAEPVWSADDIEAARLGQKTLLSTGAVSIDPEAFRSSLADVSAALLEGGEPEGDLLEACRAVCWDAFVTDELVALAAVRPLDFLAKVEVLAGESDVLDLYILPALGLTLRVFLDGAADEASSLIAKSQTDTTHHNRPLACPICGAEAAVAAVVETPANGSVKKLWCTCCGGHWLFERIRCAHCGDQAVSDLSYVHDEADDTHRLHVCKACGEAFPTVFAKDEMRFNADVEQIAMSGLQMFYHSTLNGTENNDRQ